jgi:uncharacterized short protein YbdD (DUF466 family)
MTTQPLRSQWRQAVRFVRELVGDDAYERYCEHQRREHPDTPPLDRRTYYIRAQEHKWGGINRCC